MLGDHAAEEDEDGEEDDEDDEEDLAKEDIVCFVLCPFLSFRGGTLKFRKKILFCFF